MCITVMLCIYLRSRVIQNLQKKMVKTFSENIIEKFKSIEATADKNQIELIACINNIIRPII